MKPFRIIVKGDLLIQRFFFLIWGLFWRFFLWSIVLGFIKQDPLMVDPTIGQAGISVMVTLVLIKVIEWKSEVVFIPDSTS